MASLALRQRLLLCTAPVLLTVVAVTQRYLAHTTHVTSWAGGGFGMFATLPTENRRMSITLVTPDGAEMRLLPRQVADRVRLQGRMPRIEHEILAMPSQRQLETLARELADAEWIALRVPLGNTTRILPGLSQDFIGNRAETVPFPVKEVRVEVWDYDLNSQARKLDRFEVMTATAKAGDARHATE